MVHSWKVESFDILGFFGKNIFEAWSHQRLVFSNVTRIHISWPLKPSISCLHTSLLAFLLWRLHGVRAISLRPPGLDEMLLGITKHASSPPNFLLHIFFSVKTFTHLKVLRMHILPLCVTNTQNSLHEVTRQDKKSRCVYSTFVAFSAVYRKAL